MTDFDKISKQAADIAERAADVADAARGEGSRSGGGAGRWLLLPLAGAAVYAVAKNGPDLARRTKDLIRQGRERTPDLSDLDLAGRVKEAAGMDEERTDGRSASRNSSSLDQEELQQHRQERAARRQHRREQTSA